LKEAKMILRRASDIQAGNTIVTEKFSLGVVVDKVAAQLIENVAFVNVYFKLSNAPEVFRMKFNIADYIQVIDLPISLSLED